MAQALLSWFPVRFQTLRATGALASEPNARLLAYVDALVNDAEWFRDATEQDPRAIIRSLHRTYRAAQSLEGEPAGHRSNSWRQSGYAFGRRHAPRDGLSHTDAPDPVLSALLAFLWPFADFISALDGALTKDPALSPADPPWCYRFREVELVVTLSDFDPDGPVAKLFGDLLRHQLSRDDRAYMGAVFDRWRQRKHPLRRYSPKGTCEVSAARAAINAIMWQVRAEVRAARARDQSDVPRQTKARWRKLGLPITNETREHMTANRERPHSWLSQKEVAAALKRSRATVRRHTPEAVRRAGVEVELINGALRYPPAVVRELHAILGRTKRRATRARSGYSGA